MNRKPQEQPKTRPCNDEDMILTQLFESSLGQRTLRYLEAIFYNNSTYVPGDTDAILYKVGQQDVIGFIHDTMAVVKEHSVIVHPGTQVRGDA